MVLKQRPSSAEADEQPVEVDVLIEIPRGSFLKRGSTGRIDFVSPFPCPFNYGSVPTHLGLEGDLLDAVVLGPRLAAGTRLRTRAWDAITLTDRGMADDKLICSDAPLDSLQRARVLRFFERYAKCKGFSQRVASSAGSQCLRWLVRHRHRDVSRTTSRPNLGRTDRAVLTPAAVRRRREPRPAAPDRRAATETPRRRHRGPR
jgi:inorganic pyrophosphatase